MGGGAAVTRVFFDRRQVLHAPRHEMHNGAFVPYAEVPARTASVLAALGPGEAPPDRGEAPILRVHDAAYCAFLRDAPRLWAEAGRAGDAIPYAFPVRGRRVLNLSRVDALLGAHAFDAVTPIGPHAWMSSYWSVQSALAAACAVTGGERAAFALCRPPGHHAGRDYCGGYCHLNAAAVAAQAMRDAGVARVGVLDLDYHHGNGTQDIFLGRGDVFYASVHADPATDFPFYWGHADERGAGAGEGATLNLPLPRGTGVDAFRRATGQALDALAAWGADALVVSFGADTYAHDPIAGFALETTDFAVLGRDVRDAGLPAAVLMEGGYAVDALGANVASFLSGF